MKFIEIESKVNEIIKYSEKRRNKIPKEDLVFFDNDIREINHLLMIASLTGNTNKVIEATKVFKEKYNLFPVLPPKEPLIETMKKDCDRVYEEFFVKPFFEKFTKKE